MMPAMGTRIADTIRERIEQMIVTGEFADGERLDWWGSTLAASQWQLIQLAPQQRDGLLIELSPR